MKLFNGRRFGCMTIIVKTDPPESAADQNTLGKFFVCGIQCIERNLKV